MSARNIPPLPLSTIANKGPDHHKRQQLVFANGVTVIKDNSDRDAVAQPSSARVAAGATGPAVQQPAWLAFDGLTLCFDAYFQEEVGDDPAQAAPANRIRFCKIAFYPEDDTLEIIEPVVPNSGLPQGKLLRRHRATKPAPNDDQYYTVTDINVACQITIYGRTYHITSCSQATRDFLTKLGIDVPEAVPTPTDSFAEAVAKAQQKPTRAYERQDKLKQFLENDRKILRFYAMWDDAQSEEPQQRAMVVHYFLSDDTVEVSEVQQANSGRDGPIVFARRAKLPKSTQNLVKVPGAVADRTILNVFAASGAMGSSRYLVDSTQSGQSNGEYYHHKDLRIGAQINVFGRQMLLCDCDEFTKSFYRESYGVEDFTPIVQEQPAAVAAEMPLPPHTGIGSEEDSLASVRSLIPKPPKKEFSKWFNDGSNTLQFLAKFAPSSPAAAANVHPVTAELDAEREFALVFHLADDTIAVWEKRRNNSGVEGGKFMARCRCRKPEAAGKYYTVADLQVNSVVRCSGRDFVLLEAAPYTVNYLKEKGMWKQQQ